MTSLLLGCSRIGAGTRIAPSPGALLPARTTPRPTLPPRRLRPTAAAATAPQAVVSGLWPALTAAWAADPIGVVIGAATSIAAVALSVLMVAAVPALLAMRRTAAAAEALLLSLAEELPDTAAALRLSGLEMADAVGEVTALSADLSEGVRASARAIVGAQQGVQQGLHAVTNVAVPSLKATIPRAKQRVEAALRERSALDTAGTMAETAGATKTAVRRLRTALGAASVANTAVEMVRGRRRRHQQHLKPSAGDA